MTRANKEKAGRRPAPLSLKLFRALAAFALFVLILLWLLQTVFFGKIYAAVKKNDITECADVVAAESAEGNAGSAALAAAKKYACCVSVYEITGNTGYQTATAHVRSSCMIHSISDNSLLNELYDSAKANGSAFKQIVLDFDGSERIAAPDLDGESGPSSVIYAEVATAGDVDYLVLVDSEISPISATTRVLTYQLMVISAIVLVSAVVISAVMSRRLAKPIEKMTKEASLLATGNYDVNFDGGSFREARELGDTLNFAASELSKLDTMQKELIANISHDLRTPLTMIRGYGEVMRDIPGEMNRENIQVIIDETTRLSSLVSDLLDLSRLTDEGQPLNVERFSITDAVSETLERYSHLVEKDGYMIEFVPCGDVTVEADRQKLLQVIYNLVNNAINYTGEDKKVTVTETLTDNGVRISVTDTGEGIPEDQLPKIWERYYKVGGFHNRGKVGTGLGLSIVKGVLQKHGAAFGVTSKVGCGSTFWFELHTV